MPLRLSPFADVGLTAPLVDQLLDRHRRAALPRLELFWTYYRNPVDVSPAALIAEAAGSAAAASRSTRVYRQGQQRGLPPRILSPRSSASTLSDDRAPIAREPVIENDIAWRIHAMVDFMFGRPIKIRSLARDRATRRAIESVLDAVFEASGGITLLQDAALLGNVYGHVDLLLRQLEPLPRRSAAGDLASSEPDADRIAHIAAESLRVELIEPTRGIPLQSPDDFRRLDAYLLTYSRNASSNFTFEPRERAPSPTSLPNPLSPTSPARQPQPTSRPPTRILEVFSATHRQRYEDTGVGGGPRLVEEAPNHLTPGLLPLVHIQNIAQPFDYAGLSEVEPLIPLQDELNTRLSDRAARVTFQSFKMYLAKGVDGFERTPVAPGQVWTTDNMDASVTSFGGDAASPSEDRHIDELREALDKISGVPPLATGVVRAKIGNLSSENALRVTLLGLLSKTERKRVTYGRGIQSLARLILTALDEAGLLPTDSVDRATRIDWPSPLPLDEREQVASALDKAQLGVPTSRLIDELGYQPGDAGVI